MKAWLGIDGALGGFSAARVIADDIAGAPASIRTERADAQQALEAGLTIVARVLGDTALDDLCGIAVVTGPGSFTGLRIALSYAKSLAFAAHLPVVPISSYDAYEPPDSEPPCASFVHGRSGAGCVRLRLSDTVLTACGTFAELADVIAAHIPVGTLRAYGAAQGATPALGERGIIVRPLPPFAQTPALGAALHALAGAPRCNPHAVDADYGEPHYAERAARIP